MKKVDRFIGKNSLNKTLRFSLIPQGRTEDNFYDKLLLQDDEERAAAYTCVKEYLDRYHRAYIEGILSELSLHGVEAYADIYYKKNKSADEMKELEKCESDLRKEISNALTTTPKYKNFKKEDMIKQELPSVLLNDEEQKNVDKFKGFTTYFTGFHKNRENMYSAEANSTAISYRCINDNLPRFLDNAVSFAKLRQAIPSELRELNADLGAIYGIEAEHIFDKSAFSSALSQSEIDRYNCYIGGYSCNDGSKIRGLNEYVNLHNQKLGKAEGPQRLPLLKPLYKQILTRSNTVSFLPEKFDGDNEMLSAVSKFFSESALPVLNGIEGIFKDFGIFDASGIFVCAASLSEISNRAFGKWNLLSNSWRASYSQSHPLKHGENEERYYDKLEKQFKAIKSFSLKELSELVPYCGEKSEISSFVEFYKEDVHRAIEKLRLSYEAAKKLLGEDYEKTHSKKLRNDLAAVELLKNMLDNAKELLKILKSLLGSGKEENKDNSFYGVFLPLCEELYELDKLYDKVRNYVTAKPSATEKVKLNFGIPTLLDGWDVNKQADNKSVLLLKDGRYYLAIMDKTNGKLLENAPPVNGLPCYKKVDIKYIPSVAKYFSIKQIRPQNPPDNIIKYLTPGFDKSKMTKEELVELIRYVAEDFIPNYDSLKKKDGSCYFNFKFKAYRDYNSWKEFCDDIEKQAYTVSYSSISEDFVNEKVESGELYLFQIYCKDFSERKKGENTKNLHTLYFEMLFNEENLVDTVYQINGGAEMFYRKASINKNEAVIHRANEAISNKNPLNEKKQSVFEYDIVKDKRFTKRQFSLHLPITLNCKAGKLRSSELNEQVRHAVKESESNYVIGIDRGERNLLYICVLNDNGEIVEQESLNKLVGKTGYAVDYHDLLSRKQAALDVERKNWRSIENIKELKEGYLSQAIRKICDLVIKYDAVIAMEDLNFGFKRGRFHVEKQVYQKFENMLASKLSYLVNKGSAPSDPGGLLKAYQLALAEDMSSYGRQNGFIFYVPAWLTSKIDPKTGFVNLFNTKYVSVEKSVEFVKAIDAIRYDDESDTFEFDVDYEKFPRGAIDHRRKWTLSSHGERIINSQNRRNDIVKPTEEFKALFSDFRIDYRINLKKQIEEQSTKEFFGRFMNIFSHVLQMRNSISSSDEDYLISPVKGNDGVFFDSRHADASMPKNADANGAYNIARKALWAVHVLKNTPDDELKSAKLSVDKAAWLKFAQNE